MQPLAKTMALFVVSLLCVPCAAISGVGITQLTFVADLNATALPFPYAQHYRRAANRRCLLARTVCRPQDVWMPHNTDLSLVCLQALLGGVRRFRPHGPRPPQGLAGPSEKGDYTALAGSVRTQ